MIHYFAASLRLAGGIFENAHIVVSVGDDIEPFDIAATVPEMRSYNITWCWASDLPPTLVSRAGLGPLRRPVRE
jgi:hypothetical protein